VAAATVNSSIVLSAKYLDRQYSSVHTLYESTNMKRAKDPAFVGEKKHGIARVFSARSVRGQCSEIGYQFNHKTFTTLTHLLHIALHRLSFQSFLCHLLHQRML